MIPWFVASVFVKTEAGETGFQVLELSPAAFRIHVSRKLNEKLRS